MELSAECTRGTGKAGVKMLVASWLEDMQYIRVFGIHVFIHNTISGQVLCTEASMYLRSQQYHDRPTQGLRLKLGSRHFHPLCLSAAALLYSFVRHVFPASTLFTTGSPNFLLFLFPRRRRHHSHIHIPHKRLKQRPYA